MPQGTKVEEMYQALLKEGHSKESAARIAQAKTGLSLATGKPPKGTENMGQEKVVYTSKTGAKVKYPVPTTRGAGHDVTRPDNTIFATEFTFEEAKRKADAYKNSDPFQNGRSKALAALSRLQNASGRFIVKTGKNNESWYVFDTELNQKVFGTIYVKEQDAEEAAFRRNKALEKVQNSWHMQTADDIKKVASALELPQPTTGTINQMLKAIENGANDNTLIDMLKRNRF